jgi:hypothetical protein
MEKTRTKIHSEDHDQIAKLARDLEFHCKQNESRDKLVDERDRKTEKKIDQLLPLVNLIPTLNDIVENQKANIYMGRKILKIIGYISAVIGLLYLIFKFWKDIK